MNETLRDLGVFYYRDFTTVLYLFVLFVFIILLFT
ncbi:hypothetical protein P378_04865 [Desulforamulus profundi]|uniref:Uncharacterized protein n=1 Tax=Desulforamulus profundi TaxID=1383067 RepID=A0A2C6MHL2_9FIRM|nr:hypothetical protein P378_04865 [Desulforamulus profundi]